MSAIRLVTTADFLEQVVDASQPVLVDFYADWCGPCRMVAPLLDQLASEYAGRLKVVKVNVDEEPALASHFGVQSIPTLIGFRDGAQFSTLVGVRSPGELRLAAARLAEGGVRTAANLH